MTQSKVFAEQEVDVSINFCCWLIWLPLHFGFVPYKTTLHLTNEEVSKTDISLCGKGVSKHPYGELGSVGRSNCCCFVSADSAFGPISPGCGCNQEKVDDLVHVLKERVTSRGDTAQIQRTEQTLQRLNEVDAKLNLILKHLNIPQPEVVTER